MSNFSLSKNQKIVVLVTAPKGEGYKIAKEVIANRLAACCNIISNINSIFFWENKIEEAKEELLLFKTKEEVFDNLIKSIKKLHPYSVPEIISLNIEKGNKEYLEWLDSTVAS